METKICSKCKIEKAASEFCKNKTVISGLNSDCKSCRKQYREKNKQQILEYNKQYRQKYKQEIREKSKQYEQKNKEKIAKRKKQYHQEHIQIIHARYKKIRQSKQYIERRKQYNQKNKDKIIEYQKQYRQSEHGKLLHKAHTHKRRILKNQNTPFGKHFTSKDIKEKLKLQKNKCVYCKTSIRDEYQIDHIIPITKGGSNEANNIQLLCKKCNLTKNAKLPYEYAEQFGMLI